MLERNTSEKTKGQCKPSATGGLGKIEQKADKIINSYEINLALTPASGAKSILIQPTLTSTVKVRFNISRLSASGAGPRLLLGRTDTPFSFNFGQAFVGCSKG